MLDPGLSIPSFIEYETVSPAPFIGTSNPFFPVPDIAMDDTTRYFPEYFNTDGSLLDLSAVHTLDDYSGTEERFFFPGGLVDADHRDGYIPGPYGSSEHARGLDEAGIPRIDRTLRRGLFQGHADGWEGSAIEHNDDVIRSVFIVSDTGGIDRDEIDVNSVGNGNDGIGSGSGRGGEESFFSILEQSFISEDHVFGDESYREMSLSISGRFSCALYTI